MGASALRLKDKVAVVTGSSRGIGAAIAKAYAAHGAKVVITYRESEQPARQVATQTGSHIVMPLDVCDRPSIRRVFEATRETYGRLDILVNNAGVNHTADFDKQTDEQWQAVLDTDLTGVFRCCQESLPFISDFGKIINIGSLSGEYGGPRTPSYAAAKAGVMALTHNLARFLGPRNICVNCLSPGVIGGEFTDRTMAPSVKEQAFSLMLIKRYGEHEDIAAAAVFLASGDANYMNGQTLSINGGAWV